MAENEEPLSRAAYRKRQEQEEQELLERDRKRLKAEREYAKEHDHDEPEFVEDNPQMSRSGRGETNTGEDKSAKMKSKLNIVIGGLVIAIIAVYLVLFFVG